MFNYLFNFSAALEKAAADAKAAAAQAVLDAAAAAKREEKREAEKAAAAVARAAALTEAKRLKEERIAVKKAERKARKGMTIFSIHLIDKYYMTE